jgi:Flp pilus assembly pilin Flp
MFALLSNVGTLLTWLSGRLNLNERGQDLIEYSLLGGFIAVAFVIAALALPLGGAMDTMVGAVGECVDFDQTCP